MLPHLLWQCIRYFQWDGRGRSQQSCRRAHQTPKCWQLSDLCGCSSSALCKPFHLRPAGGSAGLIRQQIAMLLFLQYIMFTIQSMHEMRRWQQTLFTFLRCPPATPPHWTWFRGGPIANTVHRAQNSSRRPCLSVQYTIFHDAARFTFCFQCTNELEEIFAGLLAAFFLLSLTWFIILTKLSNGFNYNAIPFLYGFEKVLYAHKHCICLSKKKKIYFNINI